VSTFNLTDSNGNVQRIKAQTLFQARIALGEINESNRRFRDGGKSLAKSWARRPGVQLKKELA
jgi:hypothetical protein